MKDLQTRFDASMEIDFVIIGAGAAGGILAKELSTAGFRVVVLEQGPYLKESEFDHDELKYTRQHAITNDTARQPNTFRKTEKEKAKLQPALTYGRDRFHRAQSAGSDRGNRI
jgi:choline dehydrogenase-like flavoprotein